MILKRSSKQGAARAVEHQREPRPRKTRERWTIAVSVITAVAGLLVAAARLVEVILAGGSC